MADKILRVCKSSELPILEDRLENYMYFTYDDLMLYSGKNTILENFVIAGSVPEEPVPGLIYILNTDGSAHRVIDYIDTVIAEIEDSAQIAILEKAGTVFYINSANRYYDPQNRGMVLPFNNGNFELATSIRKDQSFNNDTILKDIPRIANNDQNMKGLIDNIYANSFFSISLKQRTENQDGLLPFVALL